jgi:carbon starvation protein CstA
MILGISFLETPVKFKAPSVTLEIGLDVGRQVFGVFNKVECALALAMAILIVIIRQKDRLVIPLGVVWSSLVLQTFWLLPVLDDRVELILQGQTPTPSYLHTIYVVLEVLKAIALAVYGFRVFRERC